MQLSFQRWFFGGVMIFMFANSSFAQNFKVFFGDLHEHSTLSYDSRSGALPPSQAFAHAQNAADLDFFAITDHANDLNNGKPLEGWQMLLDAAAASTDSEFVALGSQEVGLVFGTGGYGHIIIHDSPDLADNDAFPNVRFNLSDIYDFIIARKSLAHFCHPGISGDVSSIFNHFSYEARADPFMYGVEVLSGFNSTPYEQFYLLALANGWHVGAVTGQDNHSGDYGDRVDGDGNINLTGVLLDTLNRDKLLDALRNHHTYAFQTSPATDRMFLTEFTADEHWMGEIYENDDNVVAFRLAAHAQNNFLSAQLYKNGHLFKKMNLSSNDFTWMPVDSVTFGQAYYFVKIVQEDMDVLWSSPIWVNSSGETPPPETMITPIADLRRNYANGLPENLEVTNVTIRGVATVGREFGFDGPGFLQDSTAGMAIFGSAFVEKVIPGVALEFEVTGKVHFFNGQTELIPHSVTRLGVKSFPSKLQLTTQEIAANGEAYEGSLVQVSGAIISGEFPPAGVNGNLTIDDGSGPCILRIDKDTNIAGTATPTGAVNITGVIGQFDSSLPYDSNYELFPRNTSDFEPITSVEEERNPNIPEAFSLSQNFPNPFNAETQIVYTVPRQSHISIKLYTTTGQEIRTLLDEISPPGEHRVRWDGKNDAGQQVASGVFFCKLTAENTTFVRKLILLR